MGNLRLLFLFSIRWFLMLIEIEHRRNSSLLGITVVGPEKVTIERNTRGPLFDDSLFSPRFTKKNALPDFLK